MFLRKGYRVAPEGQSGPQELRACSTCSVAFYRTSVYSMWKSAAATTFHLLPTLTILASAFWQLFRNIGWEGMTRAAMFVGLAAFAPSLLLRGSFLFCGMRLH